MYALGAMLYHLLAGRPPFSGRDPTQVLRAVLSDSLQPLEVLEPETPPDLVAIVRKAMSAETSGRYPTAKELAEDLRRFEAGRLVGAHRYTGGELLRRFARRQRVPLVMGSMALLILTVSGGFAVSRIARERGVAVTARRAAEERGDELVLTQARTQLDRDPTATLAWLKHYSPTARGWGAARAIAADALGRGISRRVLAGHTRAIRTMAFSPDGSVLASGSVDKTVRVWRLSTGESRLLEGHDWFVDEVLFLADGRLVSRGGAEVRIWDVSTGASTLLPRTGNVAGVALAPDGAKVAVARGEEITLYNLASGGEEVVTRLATACTGVAFSRDGQALLVREGSDKVGFLDLKTKGLDTRPAASWDPSSATTALAFVTRDGRLWHWQQARAPRVLGRAQPEGILRLSPDGQSLLTHEGEGIRLWDVSNDHSERLVSRLGELGDVRVSLAGDWVAAAAVEGGVQLWQRSTGATRVLRGHRVRQLAFSPDGRTLATGGRDGTIRIWDLDSKDRRVVGRLPGAQGRAVFDGRTFAVPGSRGDILVWDSATGVSRTLSGNDTSTRRLRLSPDGVTLARTAWNDATQLVDLRTAQRRTLAARNQFDIAFSVDGRVVATGGEDRLVSLWNRDATPLKGLGRHEHAAGAFAFSPDGRVLASTGAPVKRDDGWRHDRQLRLWDVATGAVRLLEGHEDTCTTVAWSPDGRSLITGGMDQTMRLWDAKAGTSRLLGRLEAIVFEVAFSPDGRYVVGWGDGGSAWLWELASLRRLPVPPGMIAGFTSDSRELLMLGTQSGDTAQLLDLASGEARSVGDGPLTAALAPDGRIVSVEQDGSAVLWTDTLPREPAALREWLAQVTDMRLSLAR